MQPRDVIETHLLPFLQHLGDTCLEDIGLLRFDKRNPQQLYAVCTYATIIEIAFGCFALVEKRKLTALPTLLRSLLEAYVDFCGCLADAHYFKSMYASFLSEKLRLVKRAKDHPENPFLKRHMQEVDLEAAQNSLENKIESLTGMGHKSLGALDRFSRAGLAHEYQSMYWLLCLHSHNNVSALEDRHLEKEGDDYNVVLFKEDNSEDLIRYFDALGAILIDSSSKLNGLLRTERIQRCEEQLGSLNEIRKHYV